MYELYACMNVYVCVCVSQYVYIVCVNVYPCGCVIVGVCFCWYVYGCNMIQNFENLLCKTQTKTLNLTL